MTEKNTKPGFCILNLGSPDQPTTAAVTRYLRQFLMDGRVIDIPWPLRWFLVNALIVPRRAPHSAANYRRIWTENSPGPLKTFSMKFVEELKAVLARHKQTPAKVALGMRYGSPSITSALHELQTTGVTHLTVVPMYPQYSEAATGSSLAEVTSALKNLRWRPSVHIIEEFSQADFYLQWFGGRLHEALERFRPDHVLLSFHGLPVRQVNRQLKTRGTSYHAHCLETAASISSRAQLTSTQWTATFQSRLGRAEWIGPETVSTAKRLAQSGVRRLLVACPGFPADNLETLEEIGMELKSAFLESGGESFERLDCPNADPGWVQGFADFLTQARTSE